MKLGVNIDHVATLRQARGAGGVDLLAAACVCTQAGANSIVVHLREDRRHIQDEDVRALRAALTVPLNLEMSSAEEIVAIACRVKPRRATLVPERRRELTTEGGLDVAGSSGALRRAFQRLTKGGIEVSFFVDPHKKQIDACVRSGVGIIELHTGAYANAATRAQRRACAEELRDAVSYARGKGLLVCAGHGLDYANSKAIIGIKGIEELNIGYAIICRALMVGLYTAVRQMKTLMR